MSAYTTVRDWVDRTVRGTGYKGVLLPGALPMLIALVPGTPYAAYLLAWGWFVAWGAFVAWRFWFYAKEVTVVSRKRKMKRHG